MAGKKFHIKNVYRRMGNEQESTRARRIHTEQLLVNAYRKAEREAAKAEPEKIEAILNDFVDGAPWEGNVENLKLLAGRLERECDKVLAMKRRDEIAAEMLRIKLAVMK
jgi:hypothetical protein